MKEAIIQYNNDPDAGGNHMVISWKPLVRCKDCKMNNQCSIQFKFADADNPGNWFCADGERKEER